MDTLQFLLKALFKIIAILILAIFVMWVISIFYPSLSIRFILSSMTGTTTATKNEDWLPAPGSFGGLLGKAKTPDENTNVYNPSAPYGGYANAYNNNYGGAPVDFIIYTSTGTQVIHMSTGPQTNLATKTTQEGSMGTQPKQPAATALPPENKTLQKSLYIRNLSLYEGGHMYTGISFTGEAKSTMFKDGKFPIILVNNAGKVITVVPGVATASWSIPGWVRFQAKITSVIPDKAPCELVFQSANGTATKKPPYVAIPMVCN